MKKIGIIGFGHLARSFTEGILKSGALKEKEIIIYDISEESRSFAKETFGIESALSNPDLVEKSDHIILAVKPNLYREVLGEIKELLGDKILISFLAGTKIESLEKQLKPGAKILRAMPNVAMSVMESLTVLTPNSNLSDLELDTILDLFGFVGQVIQGDEDSLDKISALSSSGIAFAGYLIKAFEDAGKDLGLDDRALELIANQTFAGAVFIIQDTDLGPKDLMEQVATKGGTTAEGIRTLEEKEVGQRISQAIEKTYEKVEDFIRTNK